MKDTDGDDDDVGGDGDGGGGCNDDDGQRELAHSEIRAFRRVAHHDKTSLLKVRKP